MPFPITCTACQKTFSIADDVYERKVKGRVVTIKCKQCQAGIRVDGTKDTPVFSASDSVRPPAVTSAALAEPAVTEPVAAAPAPAPIAPAPTPTALAPAPVAAPKAAPVAAAPKAAPVAAAAPLATAPQAAPVATAAKATPTIGSAPKAAPVVAAPRSPLASLPKGPAAVRAKAPSISDIAANPPVAAIRAKAPSISDIAANPPAAAVRAKAPSISDIAAKAPVAAVRAKAPSISDIAAKAPAAATAKPVAAAPAAPSPIQAVPSASPASTELLWAVDYPDGEDRELTLIEISKELASGAITPTSLVWREGMDEWLELGQVAELRVLVAPPAIAAAPPAVAPPAALPPQRPKAPSAPSAPAIDLPKPTGPTGLPRARPPAPSAPVIDFALPDAVSSAPPPPPIPRAPTMAGIGRPPTPAPFPAFDMPPMPAPAPPAAPVMVPAPALAAPFAAPVAQPFARTNPMPVGAIASTAGIPDWPEKKSRTPLIIGIVVALLAIGGGIFVATNASDDKLPPPAPISALPATAPTPRPHAQGTAAPNAEATNDTPGSNAALEPPAGSPTATPNAGFAELFASGARHADDKKGPSATQRFDPNAAKAALSAAAFETAKCREKGGPTGKATIVVTFEPSGKVGSATVSDAPFAGTSSGACIAAAMKKATVPAFSGLPGTVTKILSIQ